MFRKIPLFVIYYLTKFDSVMWSSFWVIAKLVFPNLCKSIFDIINYSTSICPFESGKCRKEGKKSQKFEYLENKKSFLDEIKNTFDSFWRAIIWWQNKNLIKIADTSFKTSLLKVAHKLGIISFYTPYTLLLTTRKAHIRELFLTIKNMQNTGLNQFQEKKSL